jgi:selenocysteine-specific elongation factor
VCVRSHHPENTLRCAVAALSTTLSTAALDKNPQSKERGITLDLGFSSFSRPPPPRLEPLGFDQLQFTLVDCPGHASLIRTIVGGAQIIDMMLLVIDVTKGVQAQTAECLVVGEVATQHLIVALNKVWRCPSLGTATVDNNQNVATG